MSKKEKNADEMKEEGSPKYIIKNMIVGNINLPELKMDHGEEREITELTRAIRDYVARKYISIKSI